jgi:hypothetical protein
MLWAGVHAKGLVKPPEPVRLEGRTEPYVWVRIAVPYQESPAARDLAADTGDMDEFAYFFRVYVLLSEREALASDDYINSQLQL